MASKHVFGPKSRSWGPRAKVKKGSKNGFQPGTPPGEPQILVARAILNDPGAPKYPPLDMLYRGGGVPGGQKRHFGGLKTWFCLFSAPNDNYEAKI